MTEAQRERRNLEMLGTCAPTFAARVRAILAGLEARGFRPRIQQAWRSPVEQAELYRSGRTKVKFGFHNITRNGAKESLAVDVLDDDAPLNPSLRYLLALAVEADRVGCQTGIAWGLPTAMRRPLMEAIERGDIEATGLKAGWDPCHVEVKFLTIGAAQRGARPEPWPPAPAGVRV